MHLSKNGVPHFQWVHHHFPRSCHTFWGVPSKSNVSWTQMISRWRCHGPTKKSWAVLRPNVSWNTNFLGFSWRRTQHGCRRWMDARVHVDIIYIYIYLYYLLICSHTIFVYHLYIRLYTINLCLWIAKKSNGILHDAIRVWYIHIFTVHKSRCGMPVVYVVVSLCLCVRAWLHTCNVLATYLRDVHLYMQAGQQDQQEISTISGIIVDGIVLVNGSSESPSNSI